MRGVDRVFCRPLAAVTKTGLMADDTEHSGGARVSPLIVPLGHLWDGSRHVERSLFVWFQMPGLQLLQLAGAGPVLLAPPRNSLMRHMARLVIRDRMYLIQRMESNLPGSHTYMHADMLWVYICGWLSSRPPEIARP